jgi:pimeloyl-ACP methyl ester carboxylesterase
MSFIVSFKSGMKVVKTLSICYLVMGGMIAQTIALNYPKRVLSLIAIYSSTGDPGDPKPKPEAMQFLITPSLCEREAYIEFGAKLFNTISGLRFPSIGSPPQGFAFMVKRLHGRGDF